MARHATSVIQLVHDVAYRHNPVQAKQQRLDQLMDGALEVQLETRLDSRLVSIPLRGPRTLGPGHTHSVRIAQHSPCLRRDRSLVETLMLWLRNLLHRRAPLQAPSLLVCNARQGIPAPYLATCHSQIRVFIIRQDPKSGAPLPGLNLAYERNPTRLLPGMG